MDQQINEVDQQHARAYLRERFLRSISQLNGKSCSVKMYEGTEVTCKTKAFDPNVETVIVENLQTPLPKLLANAILRCSDIISMEYKL
ncbi:hypothetical protein Trydic_g13865 [Trypoxylus dichotomus]